jgi:hypothetical protein
MGREAECKCRWGDETGRCKVLLEGSELIVRGGLRRRVPFSSLQAVTVHGEELRFTVDGIPVALGLGAGLPQKWADAIASPPPGLAKKLGITASSHVLMVGDADAQELKSALVGAASINGANVDLILLRASSPLEFENRLGLCWEKIDAGCPAWVLYPKGKNSTLGETVVREKMRGLGCIDTKIASVSTELTGLRFIRRKDS